MAYIYALVDPRDQTIKYVGNAIQLKRRVNEHLYHTKSGNFRRKKWIEELRILGLRPEVRVLQETSLATRFIREAEWLNRGMQEGWPLLNDNIPSPYDEVESVLSMLLMVHREEISFQAYEAEIEKLWFSKEIEAQVLQLGQSVDQGKYVTLSAVEFKHYFRNLLKNLL